MMHDGAQTLPSVVVEREWRSSEEGALVHGVFWEWSETAVLGGGREQEAVCDWEKVGRHGHGV